jgi:hypothetical protein
LSRQHAGGKLPGLEELDAKLMGPPRDRYEQQRNDGDHSDGLHEQPVATRGVGEQRRQCEPDEQTAQVCAPVNARDQEACLMSAFNRRDTINSAPIMPKIAPEAPTEAMFGEEK